MSKLLTCRLAIFVTLLLACTLCATAFAKGAQKTGNAADVHYAWANVTRVNPIYRTVSVRDPQPPCARAPATPRKDAKTASVATRGDPHHRTVARQKPSADCQQASSGTSKERRIVGYNVEYRYRGHLYMARLNYDPGERLRVRVSVTPAN